MDLRIILIVIGALVIIGLIIADRIKRKKRQENSFIPPPGRALSGDEEFELPSMNAAQEAPVHDELSKLHNDAPPLSGQAATEFQAKEPVDDVDIELVDVVELDAEQTVVEPDTAQHPQEELKQNSDPNDPDDIEADEQGMVLSLLLLAPKGGKFRGTQLKMALQESGFSHGKMDIFHHMDGDEALVSVANVLEPGTFNHDDMATLKTPGVVIFSQLPASRPGSELYSVWYTAIRKMNTALGGRLTTIDRMPLENDHFDKLRQQAAGFSAIAQDLVQAQDE
ncbi:MAG: hypothetical protein GQ470_03025 [Gammaproteobacteria bacterium]|nr:hypothetical protein [Gammaproteobacteria bacterium]